MYLLIVLSMDIATVK